jgi:hypothetical protein
MEKSQLVREVYSDHVSGLDTFRSQIRSETENDRVRRGPRLCRACRCIEQGGCIRRHLGIALQDVEQREGSSLVWRRWDTQYELTCGSLMNG